VWKKNLKCVLIIAKEFLIFVVGFQTVNCGVKGIFSEKKLVGTLTENHDDNLLVD